MRGVGLVCVAVVAACYAPTVPTGIACPDGVCPTGQSCVAGFCDGDGPSDGNTSDSSVPDGPLGDAGLLHSRRHRPAPGLRRRPDAAGLRKMARVTPTQPWIGPMPLQLDGESPCLFANDLRMIVDAGSIEEYGRSDRNTPWTLLRTHANLDTYRLPGISADGLEIYAIRNDRMYRATRMSTDQAFGPPAIVSFGSPFDSYVLFDPELSADGHTMYLSVDSGTTTDADIYVTTR